MEESMQESNRMLDEMSKWVWLYLEAYVNIE